MCILVLHQDPKFQGPLGLVYEMSDLQGLVWFIAFRRPSVPDVHLTLHNIVESLRSLALALLMSGFLYGVFRDEDLVEYLGVA